MAAAALLLCGGAASSWVSGPLLTDKVVVNEVYDPKVGSGILAVFAKVTATTPAAERRDYFILYMGPGQTLPALGATCDIDYWHGRLAEWVDADGRPLKGRLVEHFACNDGTHFPDGSPRYILP